MKRDMDLIRDILFHVEENENLKFNFEEQNERVVEAHVLLLVEAGLLGADILGLKDGRVVFKNTNYARLQWDGYDFLDSARDQSIWNQAKGRIAEIGDGVSFDVILLLLKTLVKQKLGLETD